MTINITNDLLIKLAGKPAFMRGQVVYENKQIESWQHKKNKVTAIVQGTQSYRIELTITKKQLDGVCSCPASDHFDFCKHCVAVALTVSAHQQEMGDKAQGSAIDRIEAYLMQQSKQDLQKHLLNLIEQNPQLEKQWLLKADLSHGLIDAKMLRKKITQAIPYKSLWGYRQVGAYFSSVEAAFDLLMEPISKQSVDDQLKLVMYAYQRLNKALETTDDSSGYRYGLEETLHSALSSAYSNLGWSDKKKAAYLCDQLELSYDVFPSIPENFIEHTDTKLMREFIEQCEVRWNTLIENATQAQRKEPGYNRFSGVLLSQANKEGNIEREIEIMSATAHYNFEFQKLAEKCIALERLDDAERWIKKAELVDRERFGDDSRYLSVRIKLDIARENFMSALEKQWQLYTAQPGAECYETLLDLHLKNNLTEPECEQKAEAYLRELANQPHKFGRPNSEPLIDYYIYQGNYGKAVDVAQKEAAETYQIVKLGLLIARDNPASAIDFHRRAAINIASAGSKHAYAEAVSVLVKLKPALDENSYSEFYKMVNELRHVGELKRKPNFIKALNASFPPS